MARIDKIKHFAANWEWMFKRLKPGDTLAGFRVSFDGRPLDDDWSVQHAEAVVLHKRFGAVRDDSLAYGRWAIDWSDKFALKPTIRLSPDLFAHVADACEAG